MKVREERRAEKEWKQQEIQERRREENRQRVMEEIKCFVCRDFEHIAHHCRNMEEEGSVQMPSNRFEVLKDRVMKREEGSGSKVGKKRKKEKILRKVMVKIRLKQEKDEEEIVTDVLLDSRATELVMSEEFV